MTIQRKIHRTDGYPEILVEMRNSGAAVSGSSTSVSQGADGAITITIDTEALATELAARLGVGSGAISQDVLKGAIEDSGILSQSYFDDIVKTCEAGGIDCLGSEVVLLEKSINDVAEAVNQSILGGLSKALKNNTETINTSLGSATNATTDVKKILVGENGEGGLASDISAIKNAVSQTETQQQEAYKKVAVDAVKETFGEPCSANMLKGLSGAVQNGVKNCFTNRSSKNTIAEAISNEIASNDSFKNQIANSIAKKIKNDGDRHSDAKAHYSNWMTIVWSFAIFAMALSVIGMIGPVPIGGAITSCILGALGPIVGACRAIYLGWKKYENYFKGDTPSSGQNWRWGHLVTVVALILSLGGAITAIVTLLRFV